MRGHHRHPPPRPHLIAPSGPLVSVALESRTPTPFSNLLPDPLSSFMAMMSTSIVRVSSRKEVAGEGKEAMDQSTDWYAWLSRSRLDPTLAYEYAQIFSRNELEEEDVVHFDHEFLLSMGVSVAKHRLEILKLAGEERRRRWRRPRTVARLLAAADKTRRCLGRCLRSLSVGVGGGGGGVGSDALVPVRRSWNPVVLGGGGQWSGRRKQLAALKQGRLLLTDGKARTTGRTWYSRWGSRKDKVRDDSAGEVRWDSMFRDLKPT